MASMSSTLEDYLEAIYICQQKNGVARIKDISKMLDVKPPTVNAAINRLVSTKFATHEHYGYIKLTEIGRKAAERVYQRHKTLLRFLVEILGISESEALIQACGMEHSISCETREMLGKLTNFFIKNPNIFEKWKKNFP